MNIINITDTMFFLSATSASAQSRVIQINDYNTFIIINRILFYMGVKLGVSH